MLDWDETEFLAVLETVPIHEEGLGGDYWLFRTSKNGITLEVIIFPMEGDIELYLYRENESDYIYKQTILNCQFARTIQEKDNEYIEFVGNTGISTTVAVNPKISVGNFDKGHGL